MSWKLYLQMLMKDQHQNRNKRDPEYCVPSIVLFHFQKPTVVNFFIIIPTCKKQKSEVFFQEFSIFLCNKTYCSISISHRLVSVSR